MSAWDLLQDGQPETEAEQGHLSGRGSEWQHQESRDHWQGHDLPVTSSTHKLLFPILRKGGNVLDCPVLCSPCRQGCACGPHVLSEPALKGFLATLRGNSHQDVRTPVFLNLMMTLSLHLNCLQISTPLNNPLHAFSMGRPGRLASGIFSSLTGPSWFNSCRGIGGWGV